MSDARRELLSPQPIGHVDDTPSRRVSVDVLRSPRRSLVRVTIERDGPDGWRPDRWITFPAAMVDEVIRLLRLGRERARRLEPVPPGRSDRT